MQFFQLQKSLKQLKLKGIAVNGRQLVQQNRPGRSDTESVFGHQHSLPLSAHVSLADDTVASRIKNGFVW